MKRIHEMFIVLVLLAIAAAGIGVCCLSHTLHRELNPHQKILTDMEQEAYDLTEQYANAIEDFYTKVKAYTNGEINESIDACLLILRHIIAQSDTTVNLFSDNIRDTTSSFLLFHESYWAEILEQADPAERQEAKDAWAVINQRLTKLVLWASQYDEAAQQYNTALRRFPYAALFGYHSASLLELTMPSEDNSTEIQIDTRS